MADYTIVTDSTIDLPQQMADDLDLVVLPLSYTMEGKTYAGTLTGGELGFAAFYEKMRSGVMATTNAVNMGQYIDALTPILAAGQDVLGVAFSSALSATYNAFVMAAQELQTRFPQRKIYVVDSLCASMGHGLLLWHAVQHKRAGMEIDALRDWLEQNKLHLCHRFTVDDLDTLRRGGRLSPAVAIIGKMLGIKPLLHVDDAGRLIPVGKVRGRKASLLALVKAMEETVVDPASQVVFISHGDCEEEARWMADVIRERMHVQDVVINYVGPVIGAHSGPGTMALFFLGSHR